MTRSEFHFQMINLEVDSRMDMGVGKSEARKTSWKTTTVIQVSI